MQRRTNTTATDVFDVPVSALMRRTRPPKSRPQSSLLFCTFVSSRHSRARRPPRFRSFFGENGLFVLRETAAPGSDSVSTQTSACLEHELVACLSGMPECLRMSSCKIKDCQLHRRREGSFGRHYCPCVTQPQPLFIRPPYASCLSGRR